MMTRPAESCLCACFPRQGIPAPRPPTDIEALASLHADTPSLLLLDFDMPGMDGAEVLKQLRQDAEASIAQLPTIMLTGHGGRGERSSLPGSRRRRFCHQTD